MPGFSGCHGCLDGFIIAHFTEKDHVRTLAEGGAQRNQVTFRICTDFTLADDAFVMSVHLLLFLLSFLLFVLLFFCIASCENRLSGIGSPVGGSDGFPRQDFRRKFCQGFRIRPGIRFRTSSGIGFGIGFRSNGRTGGIYIPHIISLM